MPELTRDERNQKAVELVALNTLKDQIAAAIDQRKAALDGSLDVGDRASATLDGHKLGGVTKAQKKPAAKVTDPAKFRDYLLVHRGDVVELSGHIKDDDMPEVFAILADHGHDDLIQWSETVPAWAEAEELRRVENEGRRIPGVELAQSAPYLTVTKAKDAADIIATAIATGGLNLAQLTTATEGTTNA